MAVVFVLGVLIMVWAENGGTATLTKLAGGLVPNLEGKEMRFGVFGTALFATVTTDASCGAVNAMHASLTPLGGLIPLFNMLLGEIIFGGVGSGLYGMVLFIVLTVFIAGLMVGRTPDYLGKRIQAREVTWCMVALLVPAVSILGFSAVAAVTEWGQAGPLNAGAHGLSEILYAYTSGTQNNGSAFAGLSANTPIWNVTLGIAMLVGRFGVMCSMLVVAGSMAARNIRPVSEYSFPVQGVTFGVLVLVASIKFLPFASRSGVNSMMQIAPEIEEAAVIFGVPWRTRMTRILFPIQKSSIISGYLLPVISVMREVALFTLLVPYARYLLTTMLFSFNETGYAQYGSAVTLLIILIIILINFVTNKLTGASFDKGIGG